MLPQFNIGKSAEEYVRFILQNSGYSCELNKEHGKLIEFDMTVQMDELDFKVECKYDLMARKTKNLAIEYHNSRQDKPSGITATTSDIWVQVIPFANDEIHAYAINTQKLLEFTEKTEPYKHFTAAGDGNACLKIYKIDHILPLFKRFDNITQSTIMKSLFKSLLS